MGNIPQDSTDTCKQKRSSVGSSADTRLYLHFMECDLERMRAEARLAGMSLTEWASAVVRSRISRERHFNKYDRLSLLALRRELASLSTATKLLLGRLLARQDSGDASLKAAAALAKIENRLNNIESIVQDGLKGNDTYWQIEADKGKTFKPDS